MTAPENYLAESLKRSGQAKPVYTQVVESIQQSIEQGELLPGDQLLPERELAEKFQVSRTSMRKALAVLAGMGVVEVTPRDGAYVRRRSLTGVVEPLTQVLYRERGGVPHLFEVRQIIETQAVRLAALRRDEADLERLRALNRQFEADLRRGFLAGQSNTQFHLAIVEAAKNPPLAEIFSTVLLATMEVYSLSRQRSLYNTHNLLQFADEHERIIDAIARQDPDLAAHWMAKHIDDARRRVELEEESH
jgi:GntR family transcriptional repressor for pyruvate dehydrogenase complex